MHGHEHKVYFNRIYNLRSTQFFVLKKTDRFDKTFALSRDFIPAHSEIKLNSNCNLYVRVLTTAVAYRGVGGFKPPSPNSEVLTNLSRNPSSVENTSVTT
jgi:hypothetical protein